MGSCYYTNKTHTITKLSCFTLAASGITLGPTAIAKEEVIAKYESKVVGGYKVNFDPDVTSVDYLIEAITLAGHLSLL